MLIDIESKYCNKIHFFLNENQTSVFLFNPIRWIFLDFKKKIDRFDWIVENNVIDLNTII